MVIAPAPVQAGSNEDAFGNKLVELAQSGDLSRVYYFDIPAENLASALVKYSQISGIDVVVDGSLPAGHLTNPFQGEMSAEHALDQILAGSSLTWHVLDGNTVSIVAVTPDQSSFGVMTAPITITSYGRNDFGTGDDPDAVYETPGGVSIITREKMQQTPIREARDIFDQMAGVDISNDARDPGLTVNVRGQQEMGRVNVNIDGARQNYNQVTHGTTSRVYLDPALLASVTVDKSNLDQNGGAGASAGIVTLRTLNTDDILDPDENWGGKVNLSHGTNNYQFAGDASVAGRISPKFDVAAAMSRKVIGNYRAGSRNPGLFTTGNGNYYSTENSRPEYTYSRQTSGLLKANVRLTDDQELHLGYVGSTIDYAKTSDVTNSFVDFNETQTHTLTAKHNWNPVSDLINLDTNLYWTRTQNNQKRPVRYTNAGAVSTNSFETDYTLDTVGVDIANESRWHLDDLNDGLSSVRLNYGTEFFQDKGTTDSSTGNEGGAGAGYQLEGSTPGGKRDVAGSFLRGTYDWNDRFEVYGGVRYDYYQLDGNAYWCDVRNTCASGGVPYDVDLSDQKLSPSFGASVTPVQGMQVFANYRQNMRAPTITETMIKGEHIGNVGIPFYSNANLKSEESETKEIGVNFKYDDVVQKGDKFRAKLSYYRTKVENYITLGYVPQPATTNSGFGALTNRAAAMVNLSDPVYINGTELELGYDAQRYYLGGTLSLNDMDLEGNYDPFVLNTTYDPLANYNSSFGTVTGSLYGSGTTLYGIYATPKRKITVDGGLRFFDQDLVVGMSATFVQPQDNFGDSGLSTVVGKYFSYRVFDFYSSYKINDSVSISFNVNNLLDEAYVQGSGGTFSPAPGRTGVLTLRGNF
ncbi:TonB-dependent receptor [Thalassospira sp. MCCC 1A01428]|uniref:TonB-dependent receptor n=1 Tax=Thalassospira sp. MCCC 1A01428 TaxID=1470575 RepID=UPI00111C6035|nr:TonB-dependent receptor [Thalassospira sp. MCCC 1A01428]